MDSINSFKGYGKVDELEQQAFRRKTRRRVAIIVVSSVVLVAVIVGAVVGTLIHRSNSSSSSPRRSSPANELTPAANLTSLCAVTRYPSSCRSSLLAANTTDPEELFRASLLIAMDELERISSLPSELIAKTKDAKVREALKVCEEEFGDAVERLNDTVSAAAAAEKLISAATIDDVMTWLSAALTDQETCLDALEDLNSTLAVTVREKMQNSTELVSNSLAIAARILKLLAKLDVPIHRRRLLSDFPAWLSSGDRRLLVEANGTATANTITVASDGTGEVQTIGAAVEMIPKKSKTRYVIRVKQGVFVENVILDKSKWNVMLVGEGMTKTVISGSLNFVDGTATFNTATFAVAGQGFIAKDIGFVNTAGPEKHQAVALRSGSDRSVFYRCSFDAFQDTLYAHSNRQFYLDCHITGTVDFIFGNAAAVFQGCSVQPRQPLPHQFNAITAQGKKDPNQNTGIALQKCTISARDGNLTAPTFLGRPWKEFSTTVIMQSEIGGFVQPAGWKEWIANVDPPNTIFYAEYRNSGPGSVTAGRVQWAGYRPALSDTEAEKFSVATFIRGGDWLGEAGVDYQSTL